ncbi:SDR family oxidoreductase [Mesorhizobium sp. M1060]|uniref:SDR family NAD(P)-dependent oxidoreductase n=1 Tax=unclassified Mesorhizobium TaxID=325217 RepID=UPI0003CF3EA2|nr:MULTISPECIES: SDR family oxidoreductase [unclassified Mesorhizobium]ESW84788.1 3-oxoacyl-ACP reductase [Mesorhizobium sp. LSJC285A00]ESW94640.1 3-oxoacyl-ACP reductase [Mesorhizobium sp. LSJC265A00]ESX20088.1 3-oxoacyl-ACP reductase [Mesorhizobium sp. LSJC255A00]
MQTEQKVVLITGGSQGIGAALVEAYLGRNYRVVATSRSIKPSDRSDLLAIAGDIGNPSTGPRVVEETLQRFGRVDTLINNAGIFLASSFTHYSAEDYGRAVATNLTGFFFATQAVIAAMERQGGGHVVNITTSLVKQASSKVPSVLASLTKGGLDAATRSLAIEYARSGIRVNAVSPGVIRTPMHAPETYEALAGLHPLGRLGEISDIVGAVLYLEDAPFVTGETLHVDGGQSAGH